MVYLLLLVFFLNHLKDISIIELNSSLKRVLKSGIAWWTVALSTLQMPHFQGCLFKEKFRKTHLPGTVVNNWIARKNSQHFATRLMTCRYPDLGSVSDWLKKISKKPTRAISRTTRSGLWHVTSMLVPHSFTWMGCGWGTGKLYGIFFLLSSKTDGDACLKIRI